MTDDVKRLFKKLYDDRVDSAKTLEKSSMRGLKDSVVDKYSDQAHFIYELIQNADDAGATNASFVLYPDRLEFIHNGTRHFNISDVDREDLDKETGTLGDLNAITSIANSNKDKEASIGKFGVGFKAVFQYTEEPRIYDPLVSFRIERFIVPVLIEDNYSGKKPDETAFVFPFNHPKRPAPVAFDDILFKLQNLVFPTLFLNNLRSVSYRCEKSNKAGLYKKNAIKTRIFNGINAEKLELINGNESKKEILWLFTKKTQEGYKYSCGFFLDDKGKLKNTYYTAFCFFPTKKNTNLHFIINAPFLLTDSREGIKANDPHNKRMISLLGDLAAKCFPVLRDIGIGEGNLIIDDDILDFIPTNKKLYIPENERDEISLVDFYDDIRDVFKKEKLWPSYNEYARAKDGFIAYAAVYCDYFSNEQLKKLFNNRDVCWIIPSIGYESFYRARNSDAADARYNYIVDEMEISSLRDVGLISKITHDFMNLQTWEWRFKLYEFLLGTNERIGKCRTVPVLFDQYDKAIAAYDDHGNALVFMDDSASQGYATVSQKLLSNETARELIRQLNIHAPEVKDKIFNKILKKDELDPLSDFKTFLDYYIQTVEEYSEDMDPDWEFRLYLLPLIESREFILGKSSDGEQWTCSPNDTVYFPSDELLYYFEDDNEAVFVDLDSYNKELTNRQKKCLDDFLRLLDVREHVAILDDELDEKTVKKLYPSVKWERSTREQKWIHKELHDCEFVLKKIKDNKDKHLSVILWNELCNSCAYSVEPIKLVYKWYYRTSYTRSIESILAKSLKESKWLFDRQGNLLSPAEISGSSFAPEYDTYSSDAMKLLAFLGIVNDQTDYSDYDDEIADKLKKFDEYANLGIFDKSPEELARIIEASEQENNKTESHSKEEKDLSPEIEILDDIKTRVRKKTAKPERTDNTTEEKKQDEQDNEELMTASVDFTQKKEQMKAKFEEDVAKLAQIENAQNIARSSRKYSYAWFKALLLLESLANGGDDYTSREVSINFSKAERDLNSNRTIVLKHPDKNIPMVMEQLVDIPMTVTFSDGKTKRLIIDAANVQSYSLRVKVKNEDSLIDIDYDSINSINITTKSPAFLTQSLIEEFARFSEAPYNFDDDYDMQANLCDNISFLFGPPGTGKTTYLANELLIPLINKTPKVRILVLAPTNKAADVLVTKIMNSMGNDRSYKNWLVRYGITGEEKIEESPVFKGKDFEIEDYDKCVVVTTMARLPYDYFIDSTGKFNFLHGINWDYIVVDEASMIPLVYMVYMLYLKTPKQFIIAGDPFQIEPTTSVADWKSENIYKMVHLEEFSEDAATVPHQYKIKLLTTQYRSLPDVGEVFSRFTYKGILKHYRTNDSARKLFIKDYLEYGHLNIIHFPVSQYESIYKAKKLKSSNYQVYSALFAYEFAVYISKAIAAKNPGKNFTIGIIAPYSAEAGLVDKLLSYTDIPNTIQINSSTIHGFQGDECDIIIALFNPPPYISTNKEIFLNKQNVINVAISRARDYLFVLVPDENTKNIGDLFLIEKLKNIIRSKNVTEHHSSEIEKQIFDNNHYIEENAFSTGHQMVNVYGLPERRYEVRSEESALDVQVHGQSEYVSKNDENSMDSRPAKNNERVEAKSTQSNSIITSPKVEPALATNSSNADLNKLTDSEYRRQFPEGCRVYFKKYGKGRVVTNTSSDFEVDFDEFGLKSLDVNSCRTFGLLSRI